MSTFQLYDNHLCDVSGVITANGKFNVLTGVPQANSQGNSAIAVVIDYASMTPDPETTSPGYKILTQIQYETAPGAWVALGHQYEPFRFSFQGAQHKIEVAPNVLNTFPGVPIDVWDGTGVVTRISSQQGHLPGVSWRVVMTVEETKFGTPDALQSFVVSMSGERYDV